jgi:hypothetical protein
MSILKLDLDEVVKALRDLFAGVTVPPDILPQVALVLLALAVVIVAAIAFVREIRRRHEPATPPASPVVLLVRDEAAHTVYQVVPAVQAGAYGQRRPVTRRLPSQPVKRAARAKHP